MNRTKEKRDADLRKLAEDAFAEHELASKVGLRDVGLHGAGVGLWQSGRAHLRRRGSSFYATEVLWCRYGRLLVHGDIQPCIFAIHEPDMESAVHALAGAHLDYLAPKCAEGERRSHAGYDVDCDVMLADLLAEFANPDESISAVREAISLVQQLGDVDGAKRVLFDAGFDPETLAGMGRVIDARLYYAQAALRRLVELAALGRRGHEAGKEASVAERASRERAPFGCVCKQLGQPRPTEDCHRVGLCRMEGAWG
ncbi:MAG: hypothetical protein RLO52_34620 [Sandaracinaceae bacterium]